MLDLLAHDESAMRFPSHDAIGLDRIDWIDNSCKRVEYE